MRDFSDDPVGLPFAICRQGAEVPVRVTKESCGDGNGGVTGQAATPKHLLENDTAGSTISVHKRVDGFKLSMHESPVRQGWEIVASSKSTEIHERGT